MGYSIKTGLLEHGICGPETASETPLWRQLVPSFTPGALYLFDLGFFERALFAAAQQAGAHVLMRLKSTAKVRVQGFGDGGWSLNYYLSAVSRRRGTMFDLDVLWGKGKDAVALRLVGYAHTSKCIRWYLTTVPRSMLTTRQVIQAYRLRWLIEISQSSCSPCHSGLCGCEVLDRIPTHFGSYTKGAQTGEFPGVSADHPRTTHMVVDLAPLYPAAA
jgi:hypothetical protein